jgi:hypothetical protein
MKLLQELEAVRKRMAKDEQIELALMQDIIKATGHNKIGSESYDLEGRKVTVTTKENITLDKAILNTIWEEWMPITRSYQYAPRLKDMEAIMSHGTPAQRKILASIVTTKAAKPVVAIKEASQ